VSRVDSDVPDRVAEVVPRIRESAARTEAERRIPTEVLAALLETGVFALPQDDRAARERRLLDVVHLVAGACGSTGWVTAHGGAVPWLLDLFPSDARERLRADQDVDPLVGFSTEPAGRLVEVDGDDGGLRLDGHWSAVTGAASASWLILAARREDDGAPGRAGLVLVDVADCRLEASVDSVGLTAVGTQEVDVSALRLPPDAWAEVQGRGAALTPVGAAVAMAVVGAAHGALDVHLEQTRQRVARSHGGEEITARDLSPARVARAASYVDAAALVLHPDHRADDPDAHPRSAFDDQSYAVERAVEAAEMVFGSARSHVLENDDPVARLWRDVRVGAQHAQALIERLRMLAA
jgi:3-hydroxy-9,10-secoandrosta-1,3,5(10)-triene-9,17-dione monooxygenase